MVGAKVFAKAVEVAFDAHKGQIRKGNGDPYIVHPLHVTQLVNGLKKKSKNFFLLGTASMLHDTVEDTDLTIEDIAREFGYHVASLVEELTLDKTQYEKQGKSQYLAKHLLRMSSYALTIKLCDRLSNVRDLDAMDDDFRTRYMDETVYILERLKRKRKLTKTQKKLVKLIYKKLDKYS